MRLNLYVLQRLPVPLFNHKQHKHKQHVLEGTLSVITERKERYKDKKRNGKKSRWAEMTQILR